MTLVFSVMSLFVFMPINDVAYFTVTLSLPCHFVCYWLDITANRNNVLLNFLCSVLSLGNYLPIYPVYVWGSFCVNSTRVWQLKLLRRGTIECEDDKSLNRSWLTPEQFVCLTSEMLRPWLQRSYPTAIRISSELVQTVFMMLGNTIITRWIYSLPLPAGSWCKSCSFCRRFWGSWARRSGWSSAYRGKSTARWHRRQAWCQSLLNPASNHTAGIHKQERYIHTHIHVNINSVWL